MEEIVVQQDASRQTRFYSNIAWVFGIVYAVIAGATLDLHGAQVTMLSAGLWAFLAYELKSIPTSAHSKRLDKMLFVAGLLGSVSFSVISNTLLLALNQLVLVFSMSMLFIKFANGGCLPETSPQYAVSLLSFIRNFLSKIFSRQTTRALIERIVGIRLVRVSAGTWKSLFWSFLVVLMVHALLANVNQEYASAVAWLSWWPVRLLQILWDIGIFTIAIVSYIVAHFCMALFTCRIAKPRVAVSRGTIPYKAIATFLSPLLLLLLLFCSFQSKLFFLDFSHLSYKELSLYTRMGFGELLAVSAIGATIWYVILEKLREEDLLRFDTKVLLGIFAAELLLLSFFSQHKLLIQQFFFGFRDQRVVASCGVGLLSLTFVLFFFRLIGRVTEKTIFLSQYRALFLLVAVLSYLNLELVGTRYNPIRFRIDKQEYKDYAYLLANSYDNASEWLSLIAEARSTGIPIPSDYYWNGYTSLCGSHSPYHGLKRSIFRDHLSWLKNRYEAIATNTDFRKFFRFNLSEYRAWLLVNENAANFEEFTLEVEKACGERGGRAL